MSNRLKEKTHERSFRLFDELVLKSWWVILFFLLIFFTYDRTIFIREKEEKRLVLKKERLSLARKEATERQEHLISELNSQKDPAWIELVLMQKLGLVPEGQKKVVFVQKN